MRTVDDRPIRFRRKRPSQTASERGAIVDPVPLFGGIVVEIVKLGPWRLDEFPAAGAHRAQRTPTEQNVLIVGLGVGRSIRIASHALNERYQSLSIDGAEAGARE